MQYVWHGFLSKSNPVSVHMYMHSISETSYCAVSVSWEQFPVGGVSLKLHYTGARKQCGHLV